MMDTAIGSRGINALHQRNEQLRKWAENELALQAQDEVLAKKRRSNPKIKFSSPTVFLAACASNDFDECHRILDSNLVNINGKLNTLSLV